ncbi:unnamed protein product [Diatraea saccharalis]|uniref:PCNA-associated factor n=1 Tax=Diatraea saccharalis TaxID=40085 RepID=A0A9N9WF90_9NEOP|nr:unnamed protein product [Diatraea saccharalis]
MARTKASVGAKISSGKSSKARCSVAPSASSNVGSGSAERGARGSSGGGNPVCPRETPKWQKPITNFFVCNNKSTESDEDKEGEECREEAGTSKPKRKKNVIQSDDENETNSVHNSSNGSLELEPLNGEDSHKMEEYYSKNSKGKGVGKKTKGKENVDCNVERRNSKRDLEEITFGEESPHVSKKIKVN